MSVWNKYLRWRHSKGYGVHSPFAYRFVTDVLRPGPYGYYAYNEIDEQLTENEFHNYRLIQIVKFIIRLAVFLNSGRIVTTDFPGLGKRAAQIVAKALNVPYLYVSSDDSELQLNGSDLLITERETLNQNIFKKATDNSTPVFALDPGEKTRTLLEKPLSRGLLLNDRHRVLLIPRQEMAYLAYPILLDV